MEHMQKWRNWNTRTAQTRMVFAPCGFKSHLLHCRRQCGKKNEMQKWRNWHTRMAKNHMGNLAGSIPAFCTAAWLFNNQQWQEAGKMNLPSIDMTATGQNIRRLRRQAGLSVKDLQDIFGFATPQAIYKWQQGTALPAIDNLVALAAILRVSLDEILVINTSIRIKTAG